MTAHNRPGHPLLLTTFSAALTLAACLGTTGDPGGPTDPSATLEGELNGLALTSLTPNSASSGTAVEVLATGSAFWKGVVEVDGAALPTTYVDPQHLKAVFPATLSPGAHQVRVHKLSNDARSNPLTFTVTLPVAPLTYAARTDLSEDLVFLGKNHLDDAGVYYPDQLAPDVGGLVGANRCVTDPDFGSKVCRVTDATLGRSFTSGAAGSSGWSADGSLFLLRNSGGAPLLFSFSNDDAMASAQTPIGKVANGGSATAFASKALTFSSVDPNVLYELDYGRTDSNGKPIVRLNTLTVVKDPNLANWALKRELLFDFEEANGNCLPADFVPNWTGVMNTSADDSTFEIAFSDHGQNGARDANHKYGATLVAAFTRGKGCRVLDTYGDGGVGPMTIRGDWGDVGPVLDGAGAALGQSGGNPLPDVFYLHGSGPTPNPVFSSISGSEVVPSTPQNSSCVYSNKPSVCENYFWEIGTRNIRPVQASGHATKGYLNLYKGGKYTAHDYHDPNAPSQDLLYVRVPTDQHGTYNNADAQDDQPVFMVSTNVCAQAPGQQGNGPCDAQYTAPLYDEVFSVENQAAHPDRARHCSYDGQGTPTACIYRFAHTFNTGTNWSFWLQNAEGVVSPNGRFLMFASDWNLSLGCTNGQASGCLDNLTASANGYCMKNFDTDACQRGDVFIVQLK